MPKMKGNTLERYVGVVEEASTHKYIYSMAEILRKHQVTSSAGRVMVNAGICEYSPEKKRFTWIAERNLKGKAALEVAKILRKEVMEYNLESSTRRYERDLSAKASSPEPKVESVEEPTAIPKEDIAALNLQAAADRINYAADALLKVCNSLPFTAMIEHLLRVNQQLNQLNTHARTIEHELTNKPPTAVQGSLLDLDLAPIKPRVVKPLMEEAF